jgi:hypothetical protein
VKKKRKTQKASAKPVLADHERKGKVFLPPFLAKLEPMKPFSWIDKTLPEVLWIALLFDAVSEQRAADVCLKCARAAMKVVAPKKACSFAFMSDWEQVRPGHAEKIREILASDQVLEDLQSGLIPLISLYSKCPLIHIFDERAREQLHVDTDQSLATMKRVVRDCFDRSTKPAMLVQTTAIYIMLGTGKLKIFKGSGLEDINVMSDYPETDQSRKIGAAVRAGLNAMMGEKEGASDWCLYFWRQGYQISTCEFSEDVLPSSISVEGARLAEILESADRYKEELFEELQRSWNKMSVDLAKPMKDEVLGGLIARQARLTTAIARDPYLWSVDTGRILLRCMVDAHITLAWLVRKATEDDFQSFVQYGLGQDKLLVEHLEAQVDSEDAAAEVTRKTIEGMRTWIDSQLFTYLLPVNVGSWAKKSPRAMAEEADCVDVYNFSYSPFSSAVHGTWNVIARINLRFCANPLHRFHRVPSLMDPPAHLDTVRHAAQIMDQSFRVWETAKGMKPLESTASQRFLHRLDSNH